MLTESWFVLLVGLGLAGLLVGGGLSTGQELKNLRKVKICLK